MPDPAFPATQPLYTPKEQAAIIEASARKAAQMRRPTPPAIREFRRQRKLETRARINRRTHRLAAEAAARTTRKPEPHRLFWLAIGALLVIGLIGQAMA